MFRHIESLLRYGIENDLISEDERLYSRNLILDLLREDGYEDAAPIEGIELSVILKELTDEAVKRGIIADIERTD